MGAGQRRPNGPSGGSVSRTATLAIDFAAGLYASLLVAATHYPRPQDLLGPNPPSDKVLHFIAYAGLGVLAAASASARGGWNGPRVTLMALVLAVFAALDEVTQPWFGRAVDGFDWLADLAGLAVGIGVVVLFTSRRGAPIAPADALPADTLPDGASRAAPPPGSEASRNARG